MGLLTFPSFKDGRCRWECRKISRSPKPLYIALLMHMSCWGFFCLTTFCYPTSDNIEKTSGWYIPRRDKWDQWFWRQNPVLVQVIRLKRATKMGAFINPYLNGKRSHFLGDTDRSINQWKIGLDMLHSDSDYILFIPFSNLKIIEKL